MRLRERWLVNAGLVGADATQRIEIGKDPGSVYVRAMVRQCLLSSDQKMLQGLSAIRWHVHIHGI